MVAHHFAAGIMMAVDLKTFCLPAPSVKDNFFLQPTAITSSKAELFGGWISRCTTWILSAIMWKPTQGYGRHYISRGWGGRWCIVICSYIVWVIVCKVVCIIVYIVVLCVVVCGIIVWVVVCVIIICVIVCIIVCVIVCDVICIVLIYIVICVDALPSALSSAAALSALLSALSSALQHCHLCFCQHCCLQLRQRHCCLCHGIVVCAVVCVVVSSFVLASAALLSASQRHHLHCHLQLLCHPHCLCCCLWLHHVVVVFDVVCCLYNGIIVCIIVVCVVIVCVAGVGGRVCVVLCLCGGEDGVISPWHGRWWQEHTTTSSSILANSIEVGRVPGGS